MASVCVALLIGFATSCSRDERPFNVVLIGVDTLRPDHLGCYGYERATSPNIDRLADEGVVFGNVITQCPWTLPSFATVFTSLYPTQHGAGIAMNSMRDGFPTIGTLLQEAGYTTGAVISSYVLSPDFRVDRGFDWYDLRDCEDGRKALQVTEAALTWLDQIEGEPFLLFTHYFDPHLPYCPPAPYDTLFDPGYQGSIGTCFDLRAELTEDVTLGQRLRSLSDADWHHIKAVYDGEIAFTDEAIGILLKGLDERGLKGNTVVIFFSDHGEEFYEHRGFGHGHTLYNEVIRVPLIISLPPVVPARTRISDQVRLVDITPTVVDLLQLEGQWSFEGVSLIPLIDGNGKRKPTEMGLFPPEVAFSEGLHRGGERKGATAYPWKLIYDIGNDHVMFFNLNQDPSETRNVASDNPESLDLLESLTLKSVFNMSETWFVEIAGSETTHTFETRITVEHDLTGGKVSPVKVLDEEGRLVNDGVDLRTTGTDINLRIGPLGKREKRTLVFSTSTPRSLPLTFDLRIDGQHAAARIFTGERLRQPSQMPFSRRSARVATRSSGGPEPRPDPPYFLIWHCGGQYGTEVAADLKDKTRHSLRALGYIQ